MTEAEATELEAIIARRPRWRIVRRNMVAGVGLHLIVKDTLSGYPHEVHDAEHWRTIHGDLVLLVGPSWEDATVDAIGRVDAQIETCDLDDIDGRRLANTLRLLRIIYVKALDEAERLASRAAADRHSPHGHGERIGSIYLSRNGRAARRGWAARISIAGRSIGMQAPTEEEARAKMEARRRDAIAAGLRVSAGSVRPVKGVMEAKLQGQIKHQGKRYSVYGQSVSEVEEKLAVLREQLSLSTTRDTPRRVARRAAAETGRVSPHGRRKDYFSGSFLFNERQYFVVGRTREECWARLEQLKEDVKAGKTLPTTGMKGKPLAERGGVFRARGRSFRAELSWQGKRHAKQFLDEAAAHAWLADVKTKLAAEVAEPE